VLALHRATIENCFIQLVRAWADVEKVLVLADEPLTILHWESSRQKIKMEGAAAFRPLNAHLA
jgi:hypothetical protein